MIPKLCLKWPTVVIQLENPDKAYPGGKFTGGTMEFDKAGDSEVGTRSGRVYYVIAGKFAFDSEVDRESLKGLSEE